jgi:uncharacterized membrane protein YkvA (DUF1232 family)
VRYWWELLLGIAAGLLMLWLALLAVLWRASRGQDPVRLRDALRLLPDVLRLLRRLVRDPAVPRGARVRLALLLGYLLMPIDIVPDFIPVLGYADDALVAVLALRSILRAAGPDALTRHWPGTPDGLAALQRLAGLPFTGSG